MCRGGFHYYPEGVTSSSKAPQKKHFTPLPSKRWQLIDRFIDNDKGNENDNHLQKEYLGCLFRTKNKFAYILRKYTWIELK